MRLQCTASLSQAVTLSLRHSRPGPAVLHRPTV